jgi:hypothetical protein
MEWTDCGLRSTILLTPADLRLRYRESRATHSLFAISLGFAQRAGLGRMSDSMIINFDRFTVRTQERALGHVLGIFHNTTVLASCAHILTNIERNEQLYSCILNLD